MEIQDIYQKTIQFSAEKHALLQQTLPDSIIPNAVHVSNVAMEILVASTHSKNFDTEYAIQVGLLHDVLEDTVATAKELEGTYFKSDSQINKKMQCSLFSIKVESVDVRAWQKIIAEDIYE